VVVDPSLRPPGRVTGGGWRVKTGTVGLFPLRAPPAAHRRLSELSYRTTAACPRYPPAGAGRGRPHLFSVLSAPFDRERVGQINLLPAMGAWPARILVPPCSSRSGP
jgi:hypothetical protein